MLRKLFVGVAAVCVAAGLASSGTPAAATVCPGTVSNTTIDGNLLVDFGPRCSLNNVVVNGDVKIGPEAAFTAIAVTVNGSLTSQKAVSILVGAMSVTGNVKIEQSHGPVTLGLLTVRRDLELIANPPGLVLTSSTIGRDLLLADTQGQGPGLTVSNTRVHGNLVVSGNADAVRGSGRIDLTGNQIDGFARVVGNTVGVTGGLDAAFLLRSNSVGRDLTIRDNTALATPGNAVVFVHDNTVGAKLDCVGNAPAPTASTPNTAANKKHQCAGL